MNFESIFVIALIILAAYGMHRDKVKRLENIVEAVREKNKQLYSEVNKHRMAIRRKRLQQETEKLKPYSDELLAKLNAMYPGHSFTFEVREEYDRPYEDVLFLSIRAPDGSKLKYEEFRAIQLKAREIADQFPVDLDIFDGET